MDERARVGRAAEEAVADALQRLGWAVIDRNARDRHGEIDLVVRRGGEIVAVEVRSRRTADPDAGAASVGPAKRDRVRRTMQRWLAGRPDDYDEVRFFVASVRWQGTEPGIRIYEDAF